MSYCLAIDIGASSGRHLLCELAHGKLQMEEVYRFENGMKEQDGTLTWDIDALLENVVEGIRRCGALGKIPSTVAIDTWGVDYVLLDQSGKELLPCVAYRDSRTAGIPEEVFGIISQEKLYEKTGIQKQNYNTVFQLYCDKKSGKLAHAADFLLMPEYLSYKLTGVKKHEYTICSTTGLLNAEQKTWDLDIVDALGLDRALFGEIASVLEEIELPTKQFYEFKGWQVGDAAIEDQVVEGNVTITAVWERGWYDYKLNFFSYGMYNDVLQTIDLGAEYANKTIEFTMEVCGTVKNPEGVEGVGICDATKTHEIIIPRAKLATTETWTTVSGMWTLNNKGQFVVYTMFKADEIGRPYDMYIKNFTIVSARDVNALLMSSSYVSQPFQGAFGGVEALEEDGVKILALRNQGIPGFILKKEAIQKLVNMGVETMSFTLGTSAYETNPVAGYVCIYAGQSIPYLVNPENVTIDGRVAYISSGTEITLDLAALITVMGANDVGLEFNLQNTAAWVGNPNPAKAAYITLSNISFTFASFDDPMDVLSSRGSYVSQPFQGAFGGVEALGEDGVKLLALRNQGIPGFILTKLAIETLVGMGYKEISFTVSTFVYESNPVAGYVCMYAGGNTDFFVGIDALIDPNTNAAYISSGETVRINLEKLLEVIGDGTGLEFNLQTKATWVPNPNPAKEAYIMLTNIVCTK